MKAPAKRRTALRAQVEPLEARSLLSSWPGTIPSRATPAEVRIAARRVGLARSDVTYSRSGSKLDVYRPTGPAPEGGFGAIVALPGGGWREADRKGYGSAVASTFGPAGYVVVGADYLYNSGGGGSSWPGAITDVRDAIRWVRRNARDLNVNPSKVVVMGESAGGHLAALAGTLPDGPFDSGGGRVGGGQISARPNAAVVFYGPTDLPNEWRDRPAARPYLASFLGGSPSQVPKRYEAASPVAHASPDDPPTYIVQGTADKIIPVSQSTDLDAALRKVGVRTKLTILPGTPHGFRFRAGGRDLAAEVREFLNEVWASRR